LSDFRESHSAAVNETVLLVENCGRPSWQPVRSAPLRTAKPIGFQEIHLTSGFMLRMLILSPPSQTPRRRAATEYYRHSLSH